ncbi:hypothetical protein Fmac_029482 [Flemingia macrophylla]|uniref:Uncharacterized protein n=1 Tax=Flemingia macrophylla TaxID=520843 RepID=A0ABD1LAR2_9FABA
MALEPNPDVEYYKNKCEETEKSLGMDFSKVEDLLKEGKKLLQEQHCECRPGDDATLLATQREEAYNKALAEYARLYQEFQDYKNSFENEMVLMSEICFNQAVRQAKRFCAMKDFIFDIT